MTIEISVGIIAAAFVILVIFLIIGIMSSRKTLKEMNKLLHASKRDIDELSSESIKLVKNLNDLTNDAKRKMHALDFIFKPISHAKERLENENSLSSEIIQCFTAGAIAFNKIRGLFKEYAKHK